MCLLESQDEIIIRGQGFVNGVLCTCCGQITRYVKIQITEILHLHDKYRPEINKFYIECRDCQSRFEVQKERFLLCDRPSDILKERTVFSCDKGICDEAHGLLKDFILRLSENNISLFTEPEMYENTYLLPSGSITADWGGDIKCDISSYGDYDGEVTLIGNMLNNLLDNIAVLAEKYCIEADQ